MSMIEDFTEIAGKLDGEFPEAANFVNAWQDREPFKQEDLEEALVEIVATTIYIDPSFARLVADTKPDTLIGMMKTVFLMGWELRKVQELKERFPNAS